MSPILLDGLFWTAVVCCLVAQLFILRAVFRVLPASAPAPDGSGVPIPHRLQEIVWAILPAFLLIGVFLGAWRTLHPVATA